MESIELFDETYFGAKDEEEFHRIMAELGLKQDREYGRQDTPKDYPCLFRLEVNFDSRDREYVDVYDYSEEKVSQYAARIQSLFQ